MSHHLPVALDRALNRPVLAHLQNLSAHSEWVAVVHHVSDSDWPKVDVEFWARKAYVYARDFR